MGKRTKGKKVELEEIREYKLKGALIRSRWQNINMGEKPTKTFLNLENNNSISKHIRELEVDNHSITQPEEILEEMRNFYGSLYQRRKHIDLEDTSFADIKSKLTKLDVDEISELDKDISICELYNVIKNSKNNKSPGPDGFTNEFFKIFLNKIKYLLLKLLKTYSVKGKLNESQLNGTITCIPKEAKLRNWRPITLLNSIYKFYSSLLAERIKKS